MLICGRRSMPTRQQTLRHDPVECPVVCGPAECTLALVAAVSAEQQRSRLKTYSMRSLAVVVGSAGEHLETAGLEGNEDRVSYRVPACSLH